MQLQLWPQWPSLSSVALVPSILRPGPTVATCLDCVLPVVTATANVAAICPDFASPLLHLRSLVTGLLLHSKARTFLRQEDFGSARELLLMAEVSRDIHTQLVASSTLAPSHSWKCYQMGGSQLNSTICLCCRNRHPALAFTRVPVFLSMMLLPLLCRKRWSSVISPCWRSVLRRLREWAQRRDRGGMGFRVEMEGPLGNGVPGRHG